MKEVKKISFDEVFELSLKIPGVFVNREEFLRNEFKNCSSETVNKAIASTPIKAGIKRETVDSIADAVIFNERLKVTGVSAALGMPGGVAMAAAIPVDIAQYYACTLKAAQKLMYLYGFPQISFDEGEGFDTQTKNQLIICLGAMQGVAGANNAIKGMAKALAGGIEKKLINAALTKGTIYPLVKNIAKWFGVRMTKSLFAKSVGKAIPVAGGVIGGGITFFTFKPCCERLKNVLKDTMLSNPEHVPDKEEEKYANIIDVDAEDLNDDEKTDND